MAAFGIGHQGGGFRKGDFDTGKVGMRLIGDGGSGIGRFGTDGELDLLFHFGVLALGFLGKGDGHLRFLFRSLRRHLILPFGAQGDRGDIGTVGLEADASLGLGSDREGERRICLDCAFRQSRNGKFRIKRGVFFTVLGVILRGAGHQRQDGDAPVQPGLHGEVFVYKVIVYSLL